jgi:hypothetical protein
MRFSEFTTEDHWTCCLSPNRSSSSVGYAAWEPRPADQIPEDAATPEDEYEDGEPLSRCRECGALVGIFLAHDMWQTLAGSVLRVMNHLSA